MIKKLKPYQAMKDSNVGWIGAVPAHWTRASIGSIATPKSLTGGPNRELLSVYLKRGVVKFSDVDEKRTNATSEDLSKYQSVEPGNFVLNNQQAWRGSVGVSKYSGIISPAYIVCSLSNDLNSEYANLLFRDSSMVNQYVVCSKGVGSIQRNLYWPYLKQTWLFIPPLVEQAAIVKYLNYMDQRIKKLIAAKKRLIKLLEEQKQAIINQTVIKGLDPNVPMKDSGVEWLGEVPEHWEVLRTKYVFKEVDERSTTGEETHLSMSQKMGLVPSDLVQSSLTSESYVGGKLCEAEDLVLNRLKAHLGVFALATQSGVISPDYSVFRKIRPMSTTYFELVLRSQPCRRELRIRAKGIVEGFWRLYTDDFYDIRVPVPPAPEQYLIISELETASTNINSTIIRAKNEIELLNEYRTRLIADVVTGKLDVREAAESLPDANTDGVDSQ